MSSLQLYFLLKLDSFSKLLSGLFVTLFIFIIISCIMWVAAASEGESWGGKFFKKHAWFTVPLCLLFLLAGVTLPTTKQAAAIVVVPKLGDAVRGNSEIMSLPNDLASLASSWINELRPESIKEAQKQLTTNAKSVEDSASGK